MILRVWCHSRRLKMFFELNLVLNMHILRSDNDHCNPDTIRNFKVSLQCCSIMPSDKYVNIEVCSCTEQIHSILQCSSSVLCSVQFLSGFPFSVTFNPWHRKVVKMLLVSDRTFGYPRFLKICNLLWSS